MKTRICSASDQGPRESLEDAFSAFDLSIHLPDLDITALLVFDGVGGSDHGEVASALARDRIRCYLAAFFCSLCPDTCPSELAPDAILDVLGKSLAAGNRAILQEATRKPELREMATTAVCALIIDGMLYVAWAGDSGCYLYHDGIIRQVTRDHSEAQRLVDDGLLEAEEAKSHFLAHTIYRFLGQPDAFAAETATCRLSAGDVVLLATDGLTDVLSDERIAAVIRTCQKNESSLETVPHRLVQEALSAGATDNITVLCCEYQHQAVSEAGTSHRTLTGAYPVEVARVLQHLLRKESHNV